MVGIEKKTLRELYAAKIELDYLKENGLVYWEKYSILRAQFIDYHGYTYGDYGVFQANQAIQDYQSQEIWKTRIDNDAIINFKARGLRHILLKLPLKMRNWFLVKNKSGTVMAFEGYPDFCQETGNWYPIKGTEYRFVSNSRAFDLITYQMEPTLIGQFLVGL